MTDQNKRNTLKTITTAGIGATALSLSGVAAACNMKTSKATAKVGNVDELNLEVTQGWAAQDLKIVLKNPTSTETTITNIYPGRLTTQLGEIDLDAVMESGPLRLAPQQSVTLHLQRRHTGQAPISHNAQFLQKMQKNISEQVQIVTDKQTVAALSPVFYGRTVQVVA